MNIYLSIDDTDNLDSPGSGQLSEVLARELLAIELISNYSNITRHQLFFHEDVPYTSHNSSMCFTATIAQDKLDDVIAFAKQFLKKASAPGSDPGLCVAVDDDRLRSGGLIDFGFKAKESLVSKQEAYTLAEKTGVHLSEHGGTGDGIIGALAGTGLRLSGNDGRFRGWLKLAKAGEKLSSAALCRHPYIDEVVDESGNGLPDSAMICCTEEKLKTVCINHRQVVPVVRVANGTVPTWATLSKKEIKQY